MAKAISTWKEGGTLELRGSPRMLARASPVLVLSLNCDLRSQRPLASSLRAKRSRLGTS